MAWLAYVATAAKVVSSLKSGQAIQQQQEDLAAQDRRDANASQVEGQANAANERRRARLVRSRALSVAGASGAGVSDPTVTDILSDIDTEGEVRALNSLYEGDYRAAGFRQSAIAHRRMGGAARTASYLDAAGSAASGASSFFEKYG